MKKILLLIALLPFLASAQYDSTRVWQPINGDGFIWKNGQFNGALIFPIDTPHIKSTQRAIGFKGATPYYWTGTKWNSFGGSGGTGTLTDFIAGNMTPFFTTGVTLSTTTPTLTFTLSPSAAYTIWGNNAGSTAAPSYFTPSLASNLFQNQGTTTTVLHGNASGAPSWGPVSPADMNLTAIQSVAITGSTVLSFKNDSTFTTSEIPYLYGWNQEGSRLQYNRSFKTYISDFIDGDETYFIDSNTIGNRHPESQNCYYTNITLSHVSGLTYAYTAGYYIVPCVQYLITTGGTITLDDFDGDPGQFRTDAIVLRAGVGIVVLKGENSVDQVGGTQTVDPATELLLSYVTINSDNAVVGVSGLDIYQNNAATGEWPHATAGTITAVFNYGTNPQSGDSSIRVTAAANNGLFRFTDTTTHSKALYTNLSFYVRNNNTFAATRNWVVRLFNGTTQIGNAVTITAWGYNKTTLNSWMLVSIPMSAFGGADLFNRIEFRNTGTGGTVNVQFDNIRLEQGIVIGNPGVTGDFVEKTPIADQTINSTLHTLFIKNGSVVIQNKDSMGYLVDVDFQTGSAPANMATFLGTGSIAYATTGTTIGGTLGNNLSNHIDFPQYLSSENYTATWSGIMAAKNNTSRGLAFIVPPSSGIGQGVTVQFHLADTAGYLSYMGTAQVPDFNYTTKHTSILHWLATDTLDFSVQKIRRSVVAKIVNRNTGAEVRLDVKDITNQVGIPSLYFYSGVKLVDHFRLKINQVTTPKVIALGNSIMYGAMANTYQGGYAQLVFDAVGGYNTLMAGSAEAALDIEKRLAEVIAAHPEAVFIDDATNDIVTNIDSVGKRNRRIVAALVNAGIKVVLCTAVNSISNLGPINDTLKAIAASYTTAQVRVADIYAVNVDPAGGFDINPDYDADGTHYNNNGHRSAAAVVIGALKKLITFQPAQFRVQLPVTSNTDLPILRVGKDNEIYSSYTPNDTNNILKKKVISAADIQHGNFNIDGEGVMRSIQVVGGGNIGTPVFRITPSGTITINPFSVIGGGFRISSALITEQSGGQFWFSGGSDIRTHLQELSIINRTPTSTSNGLIVNNLNDGIAVSSTYTPFTIKRTDTSVFKVNYHGRIWSADSTVYDPISHGGYSFVVRRKGAAGLGDYELVDSSAIGAGGGGGVTSVGVSSSGTYAAALTVGSSPVTSSGTITITPNLFSSTDPGIVPLSGGGTTNFLRADGSWAAPSGSGAADLQLSNLSGTTAVPVSIIPATNNAINLGSTSKGFIKLYMASGGFLDWANGATSIEAGTGADMDIHSSNGGVRVFKSGQQSYIYIMNSAISDGFRILSAGIHSNPTINTYSQTGNIEMATNSSEKVGIGNTPTSKFSVFGSIGYQYNATATGITLDATHKVVNVTATGQTITLPTAASIAGREYTIKLTASGSCTVATTSSQTIDGSTTYSLSAQYKYVTVVSDGANWIVTANN